MSRDAGRMNKMLIIVKQTGCDRVAPQLAVADPHEIGFTAVSNEVAVARSF